MNKTIYCTLDTETVGGASEPSGTYNFGCTIHDRTLHSLSDGRWSAEPSSKGR